MKITIDTKQDSQHEIKKVIELLSHFVNKEEPSHSNVFDEPTSTTEPTLSNNTNLFADEPDQTPSEPTGPTGGLFGNMFDSSAPSELQTDKPEDKEEKDDLPEVIVY